MENHQFGILEMQDAVNKIFEFFDEDYAMLYQDDFDEDEYNELLTDFLDSEEFIFDSTPYELLRGNKEQLEKFFDKYYTLADEYYQYFEYKYSGFGDRRHYLTEIDSKIMYLCAQYFALMGDKEKEDKSYLLALCCCDYFNKENLEDDVEKERVDFYALFEDAFETVKNMLHADWLALHPMVYHNIGLYYLTKKNYEKAFEFFELGSSIDYDGRQSIKPYVNVGKNIFELGQMYFKGLYVEQDYDKALELFEQAAKNAGEPSIPMIGDMYFYGYGVEEDRYEALQSYAAFNKHNLDLPVYYKELTQKQKENLESICQRYLTKPDLDFDDFNLLAKIYQYKLYDPEKLKELTGKKMDMIIKVPLKKRTDDMNNAYVDCVLKGLKEKLKEPKENTGSIPKDLKVGDIFTFGKFNDEPLEWKVFEVNKDGSVYVVSTKIIAKNSYDKVFTWLNEEFYVYSFSKEEKAHIIGHHYPQFMKYSNTYIYLPSSEQFAKFEGTYKKGTIKETEFAKSLAFTEEVLCGDGDALLLNGQESIFIDLSGIKGIRPAMDIKIS